MLNYYFLFTLVSVVSFKIVVEASLRNGPSKSGYKTAQKTWF